ncbi:hypothetical protein HDU92_008690 [Lobulomyces angularis]|nr:hypothetical protein HDU92_008690 [Lobulomyces angularis]
MYFFVPILGMDKLSNFHGDEHNDNIKITQDQTDLVEHFDKIEKFKNCFGLISIKQLLRERATFNTLPNIMYSQLEGLEKFKSHGLNPDNLGLYHLSKEDRPHPKHENNEKKIFIKDLKKKFDQIDDANKISISPQYFIGGEIFLHEKGSIGLLGLIGLISSYTENCDKKHNFTIILDSCFSRVWVNALKFFVDNGLINTEKFTLTIQSAANSDQVSYGGIFTKLWIMKNKLSDYNKYEQSFHMLSDEEKLVISSLSESFDFQQPQYYTTATPADFSTFKFFEEKDSLFFCYLFLETSTKKTDAALIPRFWIMDFYGDDAKIR